MEQARYMVTCASSLIPANPQNKPNPLIPPQAGQEAKRGLSKSSSVHLLTAAGVQTQPSLSYKLL